MTIKLDIIEVDEIRLLESSFTIADSDEALKGGSLEFTNEVDIIKTDDSHKIHIIAEPKVRGFNEDKELFLLKAKYIAIYTITDLDAFNDTPEGNLVHYGFSLIFTIIRDDMMHLLSRAGLRQIELPYKFNEPDLSSS